MPFGKVAAFAGAAAVAGSLGAASCVTNEVDVRSGGVLSKPVELHEEKFRRWLAEPDYNTWTNYTDGSDNCHAPMVTKLVWGDAAGQALYFTNLCTGTTYDWQVTKPGGGVLSGSFTTAPEPPRTLFAPVNGYVDLRLVTNFRDLGGWRLPGSDRRTRFNVFFRSANWDDYYLQEGYRHADRRVGNPMNRTFGIRTEIDLRGSSDVKDGFYILPLAGSDGTIETERYYFSQKGSFYYEPGQENDFIHSPSLPPGEESVRYFLSSWVSDFVTYGEGFREIGRTFHILGQRKYHPVVFHCAGGRDRTGFVAFLIEALCGLHVDDLFRDHLAIVFAAKGAMYAERVDGYLRGLYASKDSKGDDLFAKYGDSLAGRVRAYLEFAGVTSEELAVITTELTGETPDEVLARVESHERTNRYRTLVYRTGSTVNAVYRVGDDCLYREPVLASASHYDKYGLKKKGYVFTGWSAEANGVRESQWKPEVLPPEAVFGVIGTNAGSRVEFDCDVTTVTVGDAVRVKAGTVARLNARDVTGGAILGCWRDDVTGELLYGSSVTVTPDHDAAYTACFGRKWVYDRTKNVVSDGEWSFKASVSASRKVWLQKVTAWPTHGILNLTTPLEDENGDSTSYGFRRFGNGSDDVPTFGTSPNTILKTLLLASPVEDVYKSAFRYCEGLTGILFLPKDAILNKRAFAQCTGLTGVLFEGGRKGTLTLSADGYQFDGCANLAGAVTLPAAVNSIPDSLFSETKIAAIDLSGVTTVGSKAFYACGQLKTVTGWESLVSVGGWAFEGSAVTGDVNLASLKAAPYHGFAYCKFSSVRLPSVTNVGYYAFIDVPLTNVTFGASAVTFVDETGQKDPRFSCFRGAVDGCRFVFPGLAPILPADNADRRATGKTLFGSSAKEIFLCGSWRRDPQGWNRILSEIGDPVGAQAERPPLQPGERSVRGTFNWMYNSSRAAKGWLVDRRFADEAYGLAISLH